MVRRRRLTTSVGPDPESVPAGDGQTELSEEDRLGVVPSYIATGGDLFDAEQRNITGALLRPTPSPTRLLDGKYLRELHHAMFGDVWNWAGSYRTMQTNIGVAPEEIATSVLDLVRDAQVWIQDGGDPPDELSIRFHHRLVAIYPFLNGNGRHGCVAGDYPVMRLRQPRFSWGRDLGAGPDGIRTAYLSALRTTDVGRFEELLEFART